jgi:putative membrane protein
MTIAPSGASRPVDAAAARPLTPGFIETTSPPPEEEAYLPPPLATADAAPRPLGTLTWIAAGLGLLIVGGSALALAGFVIDQMARSQALGVATLVVVILAGAAILWGAFLELRSYRRLARVDHLRALLHRPGCPVEQARDACALWLDSVAVHLPDPASAHAALDACRTTEEVRAMMRHQPLDILRAKARAAGTRAGLQAGFLVAITPSPALDGLVAGLRSLSLIRQVAALYGLRPGFSVTIGLMRRAAWTAAAVYGVHVAASVAATNLLADTPVLRHVASSVPGAGLTATRLYWLSQAVAEACSPVEAEG